jgi:sugar lactone lactonase YvrE
LTAAAAKTAITNAGLKPGKVVTVDRLNPAGTVVDTNPPINSQQPPGTTIDINVSTGLGQITTAVGGGPTTAGYAGDGKAFNDPSVQLNSPTQVAFNSAGDMFIADNYNHVIRKVDAITGIISTFAGDGTAGNSGDNVAATTAKLSRPRAMVVDYAGNLVFADIDNHLVRMVDTAGVIHTIVGGGTTAVTSLSALACVSCVAVPVSSPVCIVSCLPTTPPVVLQPVSYCAILGTCTTTPVQYNIGIPSGLAIDPATGDLYIGTRTYCSVLKYVSSTNTLTRPVGTGTCGETADGAAPAATGFGDMAGIAFDRTGILYVTEPNAYRIRRVDLSGTVATIVGTGTAGFTPDGQAGTASMVRNPDSIAIDPNTGMFVFTEWGNNIVRQLLPDGTLHTLAGTAGSPGWTGDSGPANAALLNLSGNGESSGIAFAPDGALYLAEPANHSIRKII